MKNVIKVWWVVGTLIFVVAMIVGSFAPTVVLEEFVLQGQEVPKISVLAQGWQEGIKITVLAIVLYIFLVKLLTKQLPKLGKGEPDPMDREELDLKKDYYARWIMIILAPFIVSLITPILVESIGVLVVEIFTISFISKYCILCTVCNVLILCIGFMLIIIMGILELIALVGLAILIFRGTGLDTWFEYA